MKSIVYRGGVVTFRIPAHLREEYSDIEGGMFYRGSFSFRDFTADDHYGGEAQTGAIPLGFGRARNHRKRLEEPRRGGHHKRTEGWQRPFQI